MVVHLCRCDVKVARGRHLGHTDLVDCSSVAVAEAISLLDRRLAVAILIFGILLGAT